MGQGCGVPEAGGALEGSDLELRFELSVCNVKQSAKDLTPASAGGRPGAAGIQHC